MQIQKIINKAVKRLENEGKLLTPDFYAEAFCKEAKIAGFMSEDCSHVQKYTKSLSKELQKELSNYRIKTLSEFVRFLISRLNRSSSTTCAQTLDAQSIVTKKILQAIEVLHNKDATKLAKKTIEILDSGANATQLEQYKQLWINFLNNYDDTFLYKLKSLGEVNTRDIKATINNLEIESQPISEEDETKMQYAASLLVASFVPSIASKANDKITTLGKKLKAMPKLLFESSIETEVKAAIALRVALDKKTLKEMVASLDEVLDKLSLRLISMIEKSDNSTLEIQKIKRELKSYSDEASSNFKIAHKKLFTIATALEENTQILSQDLKVHNADVIALNKRVRELEAELEEARKESKEDFLTKLYNKRALDEFLNIKEAEYKRYGRNYCVVMFDLDYFKKVNDTFGHEAGDAVLSAFAKILKKEARSADIVGRFGGEEFVAILGDTDTKGGAIFAEKVRKHVQKARFMYKKQRIDVTVSCGVAERKSNLSLQATIDMADKFLYKAKKNGRNQVVYK